MQRAERVLEGLVMEDNEVMAVWYLLGWRLYLGGNKKDAKTHFEKVIKVTCYWIEHDIIYLYFVQLSEKYACDDEEMLEHCKELLLEEETTEIEE